jgi:transposase
LTESERRELERWRRAGKTEKRMLPRLQIVELAAAGLGSRQIAARLRLSRPTVLKWRRRFGQQRLASLRDAPRSGPPRRYTATTERRILAQLDAPPPPAEAAGTGDSWPKLWAM